MKAMETVQDLIEEAKLRTVWWALCIFAFSYFLSHTSKSMWMNLPVSVLLVCAIRILFNEVEFRRKFRPVRPQTYLSHLEKKQLSVNDSRLSTAPTPPKWKRKIDSPVAEAAMKDFIDKILKDFVVDLWYADITPDKEFPEQIHALIMDALGEISGRVKEINLVDLLTRDIVDLVGGHLDLFRRNQAAIGVDVMGTLSSEERDERLKHHLMASKELHPALVSPESEYKVLQRLMGGLLTVVLRPREAQCPVIRSIARELLTCLVMQPVMNFASPGYINELIEYVLLAVKDNNTKDLDGEKSTAGVLHDRDSASRKNSSVNQGTDMTFAKIHNQKETSPDYNGSQEEPLQPRPADWARMLEVATQRRTEVLAPENLENMWTKGRNYKKKEKKNVRKGVQEPLAKGFGFDIAVSTKNLGKEMLADKPVVSTVTKEEAILRLTYGTSSDLQLRDGNKNKTQCSEDTSKESLFERRRLVDESEGNLNMAANNKSRLKRSNSTSALKIEPDSKKAFTEDVAPIISEFYSPDFGRRREHFSGKSVSDMVITRVGQHIPKLRCRVMGAYFEKLGSKSFAVYSIAVTDAENRTWFVKRRYRNFELLHRQLKDIPNYTLHLPPKRIFSSSTEDAFVHQRCIQLDKYLQDLLSIANVAEQHEVWDFLSVSSKNYSFGKSSSVMRTLAVNVDDAVDDIVRQFKGVSDGLMRKVVGPSLHPDETLFSIPTRNLSWSSEEVSKHVSTQDTAETANSFSDNEEGDNDGSHGLEEVQSSTHANGWHSDNELNSKGYPPRVIKQQMKVDSENKHEVMAKSEVVQGGFPATKFPVTSNHLEDPIGMPPEWTPPNVSVPLLNLVDKIFQLKRRGWLRRQVFWISKQILQLVMEDAIDDWLLRQIHWLRRDDIIAQGIRWVQDVLWPDGTFFLKIGNAQDKEENSESDLKSFQAVKQIGAGKVSKPGSFELQLEAARRASDVKKMLFDGAPTTLVSLIGHKQYRRCAKDIYYFTQSTICVKQLGYAILELSLISIFPELQNLVLDVHEKMRVHQPV
ncbi:Phox domain containing protein [Parasponia andersonii]|uniref:Phox domain containing protein n=1 Tax=Parasponia andersonii TaxID=3476 RepID=A0A2P5C7L3_PARAD|nr:Phox domain containing protein [Parasponia andersonii]